MPIRLGWAVLFTSATLSWGQSASNTLVEAEKQLRNENVGGAFELVQKALIETPDSPAARTLLGLVDFRRGEILAAEMDFKKALQVDDKYAFAWLGLGHVFDSASFHKRAAICYRKAHELAPEEPDILRAWSMTLKRPERVAAYEKYLSLVGDREDPERLEGVKNSIEMYKSLGDRKVWRLSSGRAATRVKLIMLLDGPRRLRGFGLPVSINGSKPLKLMIDTGASGILINSRAAERAGVRRIASLKFSGVGDDGVQNGYRALADQVKVGDVEFQDCSLDVADKKAVADEDGLIGMDVFSHFLVTLDFMVKQELRLDALPKHQAPTGEDEPEDREITEELKGFAPVFRMGHTLLIPTKVSDSKPVLFVIDTGAGQSLISRDFARQVTKVRGEDVLKMKGLSGNVKNMYTADRLVLEFAGYKQRNLDMISFDLNGLSKGTGTELSGILGLPLLEMFTLQIDYRDGLVHFDYQGPKQ